jgi:hypothetical protein
MHDLFNKPGSCSPPQVGGVAFKDKARESEGGCLSDFRVGGGKVAGESPDSTTQSGTNQISAQLILF